MLILIFSEVFFAYFNSSLQHEDLIIIMCASSFRVEWWRGGGWSESFYSTKHKLHPTSSSSPGQHLTSEQGKYKSRDKFNVF